MAAPIWMASPPEVHSALLSNGPGPGSLVAAATAWSQLSAEYASTAAELSGLMGAVPGWAWQGPSAEWYVAAHLPYVAWLTQASADAAGAAAQHEAAAAAYTTALAAMPTLAELAANHVIHTVLVATNFFGINTIPITLNEADYVRMWLQAAAVMGLYQAASGAALASAPRTVPAPTVMNPGGGAASTVGAVNPWQWLLALLQQLWNAYTGFYGWMLQLIWQFLQDPIGNSIKIIIAFLTNPIQALITYGPLLFALGYQIFFNLVGWPTWGMILSSPFLLPAGLGLGLAAIAFLPIVLAPAVIPPASTPLAAAAVAAGSVWPAVSMAVTGAGTAGAATPAAGAAPSAGAAPAPAAPATASFAYAVGGSGDWGPSLGPTVGGRGGIKAPAATVPAAAAAAATRGQSRARRRRRSELRDYGDEFLDMDSDSGFGPSTGDHGAQASERGAGTLGFAGTATKERRVRAVGLTALAGDEFGNGPRMPMVPGTWEQGSNEPEAPDGSGRGGGDGLPHDSK
ncbi:PPE family protein [Mycobacterium tuberculosis]|nr:MULTISPECIES: type VII secretion system ESX-3 target PPE4 [Mycobacterium]AMC88548.1 PPE family protein PPE4 [Mycobacterium tuberculosis]ASZ20741.1 type VII secretion system ESX-3 target PPE4 [Mycobacterium tuberculosis]ASZ24865.1 type VII secretion system ESX-3 target PPE4 [Mycobacterium tuberculosis]AVV86557.1 type VII secretion system ESX-3 target PPE4 [Mycobacterium tuberculosis]KAL05638.1 PPE family protein PPE4 [Mycobacterium tuberculosis UT0026]